MWGTKLKMTALDRGLAIAARKSGMSIKEIGDALHREDRTIQKLMRKHNVKPSLEVRRAYRASKAAAGDKSKRLNRAQKSRPDIVASNRDGARLARHDGRGEEIRTV